MYLGRERIAEDLVQAYLWFDLATNSYESRIADGGAVISEARDVELGDVPLLGSHPVYQYLARRYGLNLQSVHFEPDENPDEETWADLERLHDAHPAATMLWEAEPLPEIAERLRALGIESIVFDPAGNRPASGDFLEVMTANAANLEGRLAR